MRYLTIIILLISATVLMAQTTRVADNNFNAPTGPNVYSTIQAAVNAASPGDIIQVQPSPTTYGNVTIGTPGLTLMGIGFNLVGKDIPLTSRMGSISLTNNTDNTLDADGTIITGLQITILYLGTNTGPAYTLQNILVENCAMDYIWAQSGSPTDGIEVRGCRMWSSTYAFYSSNYLNNAVIRNNVMNGSINFAHASPGNNLITNNILYGGIYVNSLGSNTTILNNNFVGATGAEAAFDTKLLDCIVTNNIFFGSTPSIGNTGSTSTNFQRNVFTNNLSFATGDDTLPPVGGGASNTGSGNIVANSPSFVNVQLLNTWSSTYDFTLQAGSPALNAGSDGTDMGITGGSYPFTTINFEYKTTPAPTIQILNTATVINPGDDLPVRIQAKSN